MSKKSAKKTEAQVIVDNKKVSALQRKQERIAQIQALQLDELRNGVAQGKLYLEQLEEFKKDDPQGAASLFDTFVRRDCNESITSAKDKIARYEFTKSIPGIWEQNALTYLRGTLLDKFRTMKKNEFKPVAEMLATTLKNNQGATPKIIQTKINEAARTVEARRTKSNGKVKRKKANGETTEPEPISAATVNTVDNVPVIQGWRIPDADSLNAIPVKQRDKREIAIKTLLRACRSAAIAIQTEPLEYISAESTQEVFTQIEDTVKDLNILKSRLDYLLKKSEKKVVNG